MCGRFRAAEDDHRGHAARYAQNFSLEQTDVDMHERQKNDDKPRQSRTLITIYVGIEPIGGRAAELCLSGVVRNRSGPMNVPERGVT